jgi:hypothetical protein
MKRIYCLKPPFRFDYVEVNSVWINLYAYYQENGKNADQYEWLWPIIDYSKYNSIQDLADEIVNLGIDILLFSSYVWNNKVGMKVIELVKTQCPNIKVVMGGPHCDWKNPNWRIEHPYVDLVCHPQGHGELFITAFLDNEPVIPYSNLGGALEVHPFNFTNKSIYHYQKDYFLAVINSGLPFEVLYETNRGCPYKCTYCEWAALGAKVRKKTLDLVRQDAKLLNEIGVKNVLIGDANFGIFEDDLEIVDILNNHNVGIAYTYGLVKSKIEKKRKILEKVFSNPINGRVYNMSLNSINSTVLTAIKRTDVSYSEQRELARYLLNKFDIVVRIEFILGLPYYTLDMFYEEFIPIIDLYTEFNNLNWERPPLTLLPDSELGNPTSREIYNFKTALVGTSKNFDYAIQAYNTNNKLIEIEAPSNYEIVVGSSTFTTNEWKQMFFIDQITYGLLSSRLIDNWIKKYDPPRLFKAIWTTLSAHRDYSDIDRQLEDIVQGKQENNDYLIFDTIEGDKGFKLSIIVKWMIVKDPKYFYTTLGNILGAESKWVDIQWQMCRSTEDRICLIDNKIYKGDAVNSIYDLTDDFYINLQVQQGNYDELYTLEN